MPSRRGATFPAMRTPLLASTLASIATLALAACCPNPSSKQTANVPVAEPVEPEVTPELPPVVDDPPAVTKPYPPTRREAIVDTIHGKQVADPYRWLEDPTQPEVAAWMVAQDDYARGQLAKLPDRDAIAARLKEVFYFDA